MLKKLFIKTAVIIGIIFSTSKANGFAYDYFPMGYFTSVHVLVVDPKEHVIVLIKAGIETASKETVRELAVNFGARAAVNGGFWRANGCPAGILKINQQWYGTPTKPRGAIGWSWSSQKVLIDRVLTNYQLNDQGIESKMEVIPVSSLAHTTSEEWKEMDYIVGGAPVLISQGNLVNDYNEELTLQSFIVKKYPRTAVGIRENGEWVFVVVDGSFRGLLGGMTIRQLARLMLQLGCIEALNLDGGGSSTMVIEGYIINNPCGKLKEETKRVEAVSDAILVF